jgi:cell division protein ZapB
LQIKARSHRRNLLALRVRRFIALLVQQQNHSLGLYMHDALIAQLATQIDTLLHAYQALQEEHKHLKHQANQWREERQLLIEKNTLACNRIETMILRLKQWDTPHE